MLVLRDIHMITDKFVNVYLIIRNGEVTIIDTGLDTTGELIVRYLVSQRLSPKDIKAIIITHHHGDHVGGLKYLARHASNARIAAHENEISLIKSKVEINIDSPLKDGLVFRGLRIIHTPGHTPGHICILDPVTRSLFIGDLVYEENGRLYEIPERYSTDPLMNRESIRKLVEVEFDNLFPSHGKPLVGNGKRELIRLVKQLTS